MTISPVSPIFYLRLKPTITKERFLTSLFSWHLVVENLDRQYSLCATCNKKRPPLKFIEFRTIFVICLICGWFMTSDVYSCSPPYFRVTYWRKSESEGSLELRTLAFYFSFKSSSSNLYYFNPPPSRKSIRGNFSVNRGGETAYQRIT